MNKIWFIVIGMSLILISSCTNPTIVIETLIIETTEDHSKDLYEKVFEIAYKLDKELNNELKSKDIYHRLEINVILKSESITIATDGIESSSNESYKVLIEMVQMDKKDLSDQIIEISSKYVKILKDELLKENITVEG